MSTNPFLNEGAANALVDEACSPDDQARHAVARWREMANACEGVNRAIETAILDMDMGQVRNNDAPASQGAELRQIQPR